MQHRLLHVFGIPAALGAIIAMAAAGTIGPGAGLGLGFVAMVVGVLLAGYYVVAGFDKRIVERLQQEQAAAAQEAAEGELQQVIISADPKLRQRLQRIVQHHAMIEATFVDGVSGPVESILNASRPDLAALRDRAVAMVKLYGRLDAIIRQSDGQGLAREIRRMETELEQMEDSSLRDAMEAALKSTQRTHEQWLAAIDKQQQIESVLTIIETNLQEFKLAMELRKADAALGSQQAGPEVSELQARLTAAGQACDELVGRKSERRRSRRKAT